MIHISIAFEKQKQSNILTTTFATLQNGKLITDVYFVGFLLGINIVRDLTFNKQKEDDDHDNHKPKIKNNKENETLRVNNRERRTKIHKEHS